MPISHLVNLSEDTKVQMGDLIISWIINGTPLPQGAAAMQEFTSRNIPLNPALTAVTFHQSTLSHMHVSLPPKEYIERALDHLEGTKEAYALPKTYRRIINDTTQLTEREQVNFRVGDYTLSHCY